MSTSPQLGDSSNAPPRSLAIVGGGMLGIALAHRIAKQFPQTKITLFEARDRLGGLADAWQVGDVTWDRHYHVISMADRRLIDLLDEIGLTDQLRFVETKTGFYSQGRYYSLSNAVQFLKFKPLNLYEKFRLGSTIFFGSKIRNWKRLEQIPVVEWLERWSGKSTTRKIWIPLLKAKLGDAYRNASAAFIWAYIDRMYRARRTGLKKEMFGYVEGGYKTILCRFQSILEEHSVDIQLNAPVQNVEQTADGAFRVTTADGTTSEHDRVVLTTPTPVVAKACPQLSEPERERFGSIEYLGIVCASVVLKKPLQGYYVTNILDPVPVTAVIEMSTIVQPDELRGNYLAYLPKYCTPRDPINQMTDAQVEEVFVDTLLKMQPHLTRDDIRAFRISRVKYVMAMPTLNYSKRLPPMTTSLPGLFAVNSAHILDGILNVDETVNIAENAVPLVMGQIDAPKAFQGSSDFAHQQPVASIPDRAL